jgi:hypothetical protein
MAIDYAAIAKEFGGSVVNEPSAQPVDYEAIAQQFGGQPAEPAPPPETTVAGLGGAVTRGVAPIAAGAALGAAAGAPFAGVGAIPGAIAGAGAAGLAQLVGDPLVSGINSLLGTRYKTPTDAMGDLLTRIGVPQADTEAERIVQSIAGGAAGGAAVPAAGMAAQALAKSPAARQLGATLAEQAGKQVIGGAIGGGAAQTAAEMGGGTGAQIAAGIAGGVAPFAPGLVRAGLGAAARLAAPKGAGIRSPSVMAGELGLPETLESAANLPGPTIGESARSLIASAREKLTPDKARKIKQSIIDDPYNEANVGYRMSGTQVVGDNTAGELIKQGWDPGVITAIKAASDDDRRNMLKMINLYEAGKENKKFAMTNRPNDIVGKNIDKRIEFLDSNRRDAGEMINRVAEQQLKGARIDVSSPMSKFVQDLESIGVRVEFDNSGVARANLKGSELQGDRASQRLFNNVLDRLSNVQAPDAYGVHTAKRFLDTQVSYAKKNLANPLSAQAERIVKGLRANLNKSLTDINPDYAAANARYSDTKKALDAMQESVGTKIDLDMPDAAKAIGTAARSLTSNNQGRVKMLNAINLANETAAKYGGKFNDDVLNQLMFGNEIDRMFGAAAQTSAKGQAEEAIQSGFRKTQQAAQGGVVGLAAKVIGSGVERARGINEKNAIKAMKELLKRQSNTPSSSREVARFTGNR